MDKIMSSKAEHTNRAGNPRYCIRINASTTAMALIYWRKSIWLDYNQGWQKPGFFLKTQPGGFFWVLLGFIGFFQISSN
jgi:hypothetical protein